MLLCLPEIVQLGEVEELSIKMGNFKGREALYGNLCLIVIGICLVGLGFCIHGIYYEYNTSQLNEGSAEEILEYMQCKNLSLEETADCLRDYISTFYNYTIRSDEIRTIADIRENGGDCYDYNKLYERLGKELGFDTFSFRIKMGDSYHRVAFISDETGYCLLDQEYKTNCFKVVTDEE